MDYRRTRASDERRRRVMLDDSRLGETGAELEGDPSDAPAAKSARRGKSYPDDALASRQLRLTDLLPTRAWVILAVMAIITLAATGIHFAHQGREGLKERFGEAAYIFDVDQPGSLGHGLSVVMVAGATLCSFLIYSLRRHKMDDYRGRYGVWLWVALLLTGLSFCEYTGASGLVEALVAQNAPVGLLSRLPLVLHSVVALGAILFLARLGAEMQRCRAALVVLALVLAAVGAVVALEAGWRPQGIDAPEELLAFHARLASRALLFMMLLVYGRHTRLDALGAIKIREKKPRKKSAEKPAEVKEKAAEKHIEKPIEKTAAPSKPTIAASVPAPAKDPPKPAAPVKPAIITAPKPVLTLGQKPDKEDEESRGNQRLSRSERRRLKQLGKAA